VPDLRAPLEDAMDMLVTVPMPFDQQVKLAEAFAKSKMFGITTPEQALALMCLCEAEGLHPATAVRDYHIIQGRPAMKAEAMLARFLRNGGKVEWHERTDKVAEATFSHPAGGTVRVRWDLLMAKTAGLAGKEMYQKYPRALLHARCVSEGVRAVDPQSTGHQYTPEEIRDFQPMNSVATEVIDYSRRDEYTKKLRDAMDMEEEAEIINGICAIHDELNADQDLYRAVWSQFHSTDRKNIKQYIKMGKPDNGIPPAQDPEHAEFFAGERT
jgi:hypothetical protein